VRLFGRHAPDPLGDGVWRRAHDRFRRAVDRYHQVLEQVPAGEARQQLERTGADLAGRLDDVRALCLRAQQLAPSGGDNVPGGHCGTLLDVHHALTRAATLSAQAAEAVTLTVVTLRAQQPGEAAKGAAAAARAAAQAAQQIERAETMMAALLKTTKSDGGSYRMS
jgi:hypothetical protein